MIRTTAVGSTLPISLDDVKDHLHVSGERENDSITLLIRSASNYVEVTTGLVLGYKTFTWERALPRTPVPLIELPRGPVTDIGDIVVLDTDGDTHSVTSSNYRIVWPASVELDSGWKPDLGDDTQRRTRPLRFTFTAGYISTSAGAQDTPDEISDYLRLAVADMYYNREPSSAARDMLDALRTTFGWRLG